MFKLSFVVIKKLLKVLIFIAPLCPVNKTNIS